MQKIAPKILTTGEIIKYAATEIQRKVLGKKMPAYKPQFTKCVEHFLIHAGGAKVLDGIGKELQLDEYALEPSRMVLHDYGNVSSSTTWYTMGYLESVRGTKKGDKLLQIGVGSGVKCGVNVWTAVRDVHDVQDAWAHRATDSSVLKQRRSRSNIGSHLVMLALFVLFAAVVLQYAANAGLLDRFEPVLAPVQKALAPAFEPAQQLMQPLVTPLVNMLTLGQEQVKQLMQG
eukprot:GHUV01026745.1.p1 GENE.GHUV01026745.1~~GHUV01026745.1.p1  ORF type:complete len:231 (+),score=90.46 GHUV01026745.1:292-984(+)